ncbi:hypothetical protein L1887_23736 [Cichorium endivia]|nr:hypothetical protein L1887_23736 [Cichorium endivia]
MCGVQLLPKHVDGFNCRILFALCFVSFNARGRYHRIFSFSYVMFIQFNSLLQYYSNHQIPISRRLDYL